MELEHAIRTRRTHKVYGPDPVPRDVLDELLELARWAPNHKLTNPWRFRVIGPETLERLVAVSEQVDPGSGSKLRRAPTLVVVSSIPDAKPALSVENEQSTSIAAYIVLLAAHARGYVGYWRSPSVIYDRRGREVLGIASDETTIGLLHLGSPIEERAAPERAPVEDVTTYLN